MLLDIPIHHYKRCAQAFVATCYFTQHQLQSLPIELACQAQRQCLIIDRILWFELLQEPETPLSKRERQDIFSRALRNDMPVVLLVASALQPFRQEFLFVRGKPFPSLLKLLF